MRFLERTWGTHSHEYSDIALFAGLWFDCEKEMYENIEGLERLP